MYRERCRSLVQKYRPDGSIGHPIATDETCVHLNGIHTENQRLSEHPGPRLLGVLAHARRVDSARRIRDEPGVFERSNFCSISALERVNNNFFFPDNRCRATSSSACTTWTCPSSTCTCRTRRNCARKSRTWASSPRSADRSLLRRTTSRSWARIRD